MKNIAINILCAGLAGAALCTGCKDPGRANMLLYENFVTDYYIIDGIYAATFWESESDSVYVDVGQETSILIGGRISLWVSTRSPYPYEQRKFQALAQKHHDTSYNRYLPWETAQHYAVSPDFVCVDIVSDADYDPEHPAGSPLADLTELTVETYGPYVCSQYTPPERTEATKRTDSFTSHELALVASSSTCLTLRRTPVFQLRFLRAPTLSDTHNITVTLTADEGERFEATFNATFL